jgi:hypothetical protein
VAKNRVFREDRRVLTEKEVAQSWRAMFKGRELNDKLFKEAEALIDQLRAESPLRHRLSGELEELRKLAVAR